MKKLILILTLTFLFIIIQKEFLNAEVDKKEPSKEEQDHNESGHNHSKGKEKDKGHEEENHNHDEGKAQEHKGEGHEDHEEEEQDGDHEEKGSSAVGPDKGIIEKGENGFKLSPEAIHSFELKMQNILRNISEYPRLTLVEVKDEKFVYRFRDGWIKRTAVKVIKKSKELVTLEISSFKAGDKIIVDGTGFVRVSELVAEEGVSHGHSH